MTVIEAELIMGGTELEDIIEQKTTYDAVTGEILSQTSKSVRTKRKAADYEFRAAITPAGLKDNRPFTFVKNRAAIGLQGLTNSDIGYLFFLSTYGNYRNELYISNTSNVPATVQDFVEETNKDIRTINKVFKKLIKTGYIEQKTKKVYNKEITVFVLENRIFTRGRKTHSNTIQSTKQFHETVQELFCINGASCLGWIVKLLPYIDRETNFLCHNPNREFDYDDLLPLSVADIANITGNSKKYVYEKLKYMRIKEYAVFAEIVTFGTSKKLKINPLVYCKIKGLPAATVLKDFTVQGV